MNSGRKTRVHHVGIPTPNGCRWCGDAQEHHGSQWVASVGLHHWEAPTAAQRLRRMQVRRSMRSTELASMRPNNVDQHPGRD